MDNLNVTVIVGNLTKDPELKHSNNQNAICTFSIANNRSYMKNDQKVEDVSFFEIVTWSKLAEICNEYLKKGSQVIVEGRLKQNRWTDQSGNNRSKVIINANNIQFLTRQDKNNNQNQSENNSENVQYAKKVFQDAPQDSNPDYHRGDDELPF